MHDRIRFPAIWLIGCALALAVAGGIGGLFLSAGSVAAQPIFVTNTPRPPDRSQQTPEAPLDRYALRLWSEDALIDVLASQVTQLAEDEPDEQLAIRLTQHELQRRFPGAPHDPAQRERLLNVMLAAPRASVDMRGVVRPHLVTQLNTRSGEYSRSSRGTLVVDGFLVEITPLNLDSDTSPDAMLHVRYPADGESLADLLYKDYFLVQGDGEGYRLLPGHAGIPAAPFDPIVDVGLLRASDVNRDGVDEMVLTVDTGDINNELVIYGWRNGDLVNLVQPDQHISYGMLIDTPAGNPALAVAHYRLESARWNCLSQITVTWEWSANFYRPSIGENADYRNLNTVGCRLYEAEPVFAQPADDGIELVSGLLERASPDEQGYDRGGMALAMLYLLDGQTQSAEEQTAALLPLAENNRWLSAQIDAFAQAAAGGTSTPVEVCAALIRQNENGACDVDQVLEQLFLENPLERDEDLVDQLEALGLPVLEVVTVSQVGRLDRQMVNFDLTGASWWAFAPTDPDHYVPSPTDPPAGFEPAALPQAFVSPPESAFDVLLADGDVVGALNALDNAARDAPDVPLSAYARYLRALGYDLLGDRQDARRTYYLLWRDHSDTIWGQLAGAHLERR